MLKEGEQPSEYSDEEDTKEGVAVAASGGTRLRPSGAQLAGLDGSQEQDKKDE